jgi:arylsulfatase A-like enzyme
LHAELLDVPTLIWAPGRLEPGIHTAPAATADLLPTAASLAGLEPAIGQGRDLLAPALQTQRPILAGSLLYGSQQSCLSFGLWKLIVPEAPGAASRLYWLAGDPAEQHDRLATEPARSAALADLLARTAAETGQSTAASPEPPGTVPLDPELEQSLRALGYLD